MILTPKKNRNIISLFSSDNWYCGIEYSAVNERWFLFCRTVIVLVVQKTTKYLLGLLWIYNQILW